MLKINAVGNLTGDVEVRTNEITGKTYAVFRIASDRRYKAADGSGLTDFISVKVRGTVMERCVQMARKGSKVAVHGDFETIDLGRDHQPGFLIKATDVEILSPKRTDEDSEDGFPDADEFADDGVAA